MRCASAPSGSRYRPRSAPNSEPSAGCTGPPTRSPRAAPSRSSARRSRLRRRPEVSATTTRSDHAVAPGEPLLEVSDLRTLYSLRGSFVDRLRGREAGSVKAVDGVSFVLRRGEVLGIVGESGSGKTTLGRTLLGLVEAASGSIRFEGEEIAGLGDSKLRDLRRRLQIVFQDPHASLNPALTVGASVGDPLRFHGLADDEDALERRVADALERVG